MRVHVRVRVRARGSVHTRVRVRVRVPVRVRECVCACAPDDSLHAPAMPGRRPIPNDSDDSQQFPGQHVTKIT